MRRHIDEVLLKAKLKMSPGCFSPVTMKISPMHLTVSFYQFSPIPPVLMPMQMPPMSSNCFPHHCFTNATNATNATLKTRWAHPWPWDSARGWKGEWGRRWTNYDNDHLMMLVWLLVSLLVSSIKRLRRIFERFLPSSVYLFLSCYIFYLFSFSKGGEEVSKDAHPAPFIFFMLLSV